MTLRLVSHDEEPSAWVLDPAVIPDVLLGKRLIHRKECLSLNSREVAWEITHRILLVQRWARYYAISTTQVVVLATGLLSSTRRM